MAKGECQTSNKGDYASDNEDEKEVIALDDDDIALLKTYTPAAPAFLSSTLLQKQEASVYLEWNIRSYQSQASTDCACASLGLVKSNSAACYLGRADPVLVGPLACPLGPSILLLTH